MRKLCQIHRLPPVRPPSTSHAVKCLNSLEFSFYAYHRVGEHICALLSRWQNAVWMTADVKPDVSEGLEGNPSKWHYGGGGKNAVSKLIWKGLLQDFSFTATFCSALLKPHFPQCTQMTGPQQTMFHSLIFLQPKKQRNFAWGFCFLLFFNSAQWLQAPQQQILLMLDGLWLYEPIARVQF